MVLSTAQLNDIWARFLAEKNLHPDRIRYISRDYSRVARRSRLAEEFESWLFDQGAMVVQVNGTRHLEILNRQRGLLFVLKYS